MDESCEVPEEVVGSDMRYESSAVGSDSEDKQTYDEDSIHKVTLSSLQVDQCFNSLYLVCYHCVENREPSQAPVCAPIQFFVIFVAFIQKLKMAPTFLGKNGL